MVTADDFAVIDSPVGPLELSTRSNQLLSLDFLEETAEFRTPATRFLRNAVKRLADYFQDPKARLGLPLTDRGTPYQRTVWNALSSIPAGGALTYGQLARQAGGSPRSLAAACKANPWPIVVPCHRVIAGSGLGGYCGATAGRALEIKRWLLHHEGWRGEDGGK